MSNTHLFRPSFATSFPTSQSSPTEINPSTLQVRPDEKFLSYLPHSGFHNQRIALENALVLARMLNRTLLVPPIRFGHKAIPYRNFTFLQRISDANYTAYLCQLSDKAARRNNRPVTQGRLLGLSGLPERCVLAEKRRPPITYTYLPWGWITDFDFIRELQPIVQTLGTHFWLSAQPNLRFDDVLVIQDTSKYQYRFTEDFILDPLSDPRTYTNLTYSEDVPLSSLANHPAKLVQLGSLFGSHRIKLSDPAHRAIRKQIRRHMALKHPLLQKSSAAIVKKISISGSGFLGAHLRCNDGYFLETATEHSRMLWWKLVHGILGLSVERTRQLELDYGISGQRSRSRQFQRYVSPSNSPINRPFKHDPSGDNIHHTKCRGQLHTDPDLKRLNIPLFIATDSRNPYTNEHFGLFRKTFPCLFFLVDFSQDVKPIAGIRDPVSGMVIGDMLVPFLDAMVVAKAARVVGTPHSTFSWYVQDVLWRVNHGMDIEERNGD